MSFFVIFCFEKCAEIPICTFFLKIKKNWQKMPPKKTITFHILQNRLIKNRYVALPFFEKMCFFELAFLKENTDVEQKAKLKVRKKTDKEREFERKKKRGNQQK